MKIENELVTMLLAFVLLGQLAHCSEFLIDIDNVPDDFEIPERIDEKTAKEIAKFSCFLSRKENIYNRTWDELQVRIYPFYDIRGINKSYLAVVYLGEGDMPNDKTIEANVLLGDKASEKIRELRKEGKEVPDNLVLEARLKTGRDVVINKSPYYSTIISEVTSGILANVGRGYHGLSNLIYNKPAACRAVSELTGSSAIETGYSGCKLTGPYIEVLSGDNYYSVYENLKIYPKEDRIKSYDNLLEKRNSSETYNDFADKLFKAILYEIQTNPKIVDGTFIKTTID